MLHAFRQALRSSGLHSGPQTFPAHIAGLDWANLQPKQGRMLLLIVHQSYDIWTQEYKWPLAALQGFLAEGLQRTTAGLGSVIIDSQPLSVAVLASILFGETLSGAGYVGLIVGLLGLVLLEVTPETISSLLSSGKQAS